MDVRGELIAKIKVLNNVWESQADQRAIDAWLDNFSDSSIGSLDEQQIHALFLLSRFMYFGRIQMRELLRSMYRDLFRYRIVEHVRRSNSDTLDEGLIRAEFDKALRQTRFLGVGNPSESGTHLLYYFRQENALDKSLFINTHSIFDRAGPQPVKLRDPTVDRYVFIDDFCGSGEQGEQYSKDIVETIKTLNADAEVCYYVLFATAHGLERIRQATKFSHAAAVFELDESYRCFGPESRYFGNAPTGVTKDYAENMAGHYGKRLVPMHPLGYLASQLLIGFYHNTPDNTLPIVWYAEPTPPWVPLFRRYPKLYAGGNP